MKTYVKSGLNAIRMSSIVDGDNFPRYLDLIVHVN